MEFRQKKFVWYELNEDVGDPLGGTAIAVHIRGDFVEVVSSEIPIHEWEAMVRHYAQEFLGMKEG